MVMGEYASMTAIYAVLPEFIPRPLAWGTYTAVPNTYFFLCEYRDMLEDMPDSLEFTSLLGRLHHGSRSPTGKFGFHMTTYAGNLPQLVEWEDSWEVFFSKSMRHALDLEIERKGKSDELDMLSEVLFAKVIPRLLRPLETDGRSVTPTLVHGDLWYANSGVDMNSGQLLVFDACCFYAHYECKHPLLSPGFRNHLLTKPFLADEFGQWRPPCNRFGDDYVKAYFDKYRKSQPLEDFYARLDLYRLWVTTMLRYLSSTYAGTDVLIPMFLRCFRKTQS